jgi:hypothetical protein
MTTAVEEETEPKWLRTCITRAGSVVGHFDATCNFSPSEDDTLMIRGVRNDGQLFVAHLSVGDPRATPEGLRKILSDDCLHMHGKIKIPNLNLHKGQNNWVEE